MNTRELAKIVSDVTGTSETVTKATLDVTFSKIVEAIARGEDVGIVGFGRFARKDCAPRTGRNPRTGKPMSIPASSRVTFTAGKRFKRGT